jgi:hypothetical protein
MKQFPNWLYKKDVKDFIQDRIHDGIKDFESLDELDQDKLVVMAMSLLEGDSYSCIINADDYDTMLGEMMRYIMTNSNENAYSLAETLRKNAIQYFTEDFNLIFEEMIKWQ